MLCATLKGTSIHKERYTLNTTGGELCHYT